MTTVGRMVAVLTAQTSPFERALHRSRTQVQQLGTAVTNVRRVIVGFGAAVAGVVGIRMLTHGVTAAFRAVDELAKSADRVGATTQSLQRLRLAADLSGASAEDLQSSMERLQRSLAEAAAGGGQAREALDRLGLDARRLQGMGMDRVILELSGALETVENRSERTRLMFQLFGREGAKLFTMMSQGRAALEGVGDELQRAGVLISRVDAARVEQANDAWTRFRHVMEGVRNVIAVELAPFLELASNRLVDMAGSGEGVGQRVRDTFEGVRIVIGEIGDAIQRVTAVALRAVSALTKGITHLAARLGAGVEELEAMTTARFELNRLASSIESMETPSQAIERTWTEIEGRARQTAMAMQEQAAASAEAARVAAEMDAEIERQNAIIAEQQRLAQEAGRVWERTRTPLERYTAEMEHLQTLLDAGALDWDTYGRAVEAARSELERLTAEAPEVTPPQRITEAQQIRISETALASRVDTRPTEKPASEQQQKRIVQIAEQIAARLQAPLELAWS